MNKEPKPVDTPVLPSEFAADIDAYEAEIARYVAGALPGGVFKAKRVPRGVYEQRRDGTFMMRVRVAGGVLSAGQANVLAALSRTYASGWLHVTTRQDVQFHDVVLNNTPAIMRQLLSVGLTSKGGGGNTVRNVMSCPLAGICPSACFDVTVCAQAVTEYLVAQTGSYHLPRKYKIAFSGCGADCALAQVSDLGYVAVLRNGEPGFRLYAGGGMGARSRLGDVLFDWSPAHDILRVAETVRRLFDRLGDRQNRQRARLRFVFERLGLETFRDMFERELQVVIDEGVPAWRGELTCHTEGYAGISCGRNNREQSSPPDPAPPALTLRDGLRVIPQHQSGYVAVPLHLPMGFLPASDFDRIGELAGQFSREGAIRTTREQNMLIRFVAEADLPALAKALSRLDTDVLSSDPLDRFVACAGASTCRLGFCLARNAARACAAALADSDVSRQALEAIDLHVNGCANACGQHPIAGIGYFGLAQRVEGRLIPSYGITLGGRCNAAGARFGRYAGNVPAAALPAFTKALVMTFAARRLPGESFPAFTDRIGAETVDAMVARHAKLPDGAGRAAYARDLGADEPFSLAGRGAGECGAGVFEVIQQDLDSARRATAPFEILLPAARALLITRGVDARDAETVLHAFERHFLDTGLIPSGYRALIGRARGYLEGWQAAFDGQTATIAGLRDCVTALYATLDANLDFHPPEKTGQTTGVESSGRPTPEPAGSVDTSCAASAEQRDGNAVAELDLRGVACPMNFVKAKLRLETMQIGDRLAIRLDDGEPIANVPGSLKGEGQVVESMTACVDGHWRILVCKQA